MKTCKYLFCVLTVLFVWSSVLTAQNIVEGTVKDSSDKNAISNVLVKVLTSDKNILKYTETDKNGAYKVSFKTDEAELYIEFSLLGYGKKLLPLKNQSNRVNVELSESSFQLKEVTVKAPAITSRGDTVNYSVSAFSSKADRKIEDIIKKLPGVTVKESGQIEYKGEPINKFYIEGLDMLDGKYNLATRNIGVQDVTTVQILENHQPVRLLQGIESSKHAAMNLKLKNKGMTAPSGNIELGVGYSDNMLYKAGIFGLMVGARQQLLFSAKANNISDNLGSELLTHTQRGRSHQVKAGRLISPIIVNAPYPLTDRSGYRDDAIASVNAIRKTSDVATAKVNFSYSRERMKNSRSMASSYYLSDEVRLVNEEIASELLDNKLEGVVTYEKNAQRAYIKNAFSSNFSFGENSMSAISNSNNNHHQGFVAKQINLANQLSLIWQKKDYIYSLNSFVGGGNILNNRLKIESSNVTAPIEQIVSGYSIYTSHSTSFIKSFNSTSNLGIDLKLESESDNIHTDLTNPALDANNVLSNQIRGNKLIAGSLLTYRYMGDKWRLTMRIPLDYYYIHYDGSKDFKLNKPTVKPKVNLVYKYSPGLMFDLSGGYSYSFGDILSFLSEPIQKSYNHISKNGTGILAQSQEKVVSAGYFYRNTMRGFFSNFSMSYYQSKRNVLRGSNILPDNTVSAFSVGTENLSDNAMATLYLAKNLQDIKTVVSLTSTAMLSNNEQQRQGISTGYKHTAYQLMPNIQFSGLDWLSLKTSGVLHFANQKTDIMMQPQYSKIQNYGADLDVSLLPFENAELYYSLQYNHQQMGGNNKKENFIFMDCGARYIVAKKWEFELSLRNLTNTQHYTIRNYQELDFFETNYIVRPFSVLFSVKTNY